MRRFVFYVSLLIFLSACASEFAPGQSDTIAGNANSGKADQLQDGGSIEANTDGEDSNGDDTTHEADGATEEETGDVVAVVDPFAPAHDVNLHHVVFAEDLEAPDYDYPRVETGFRLSGTEFWQKWSGGLNPTYSYSEGTEFGRRCMYASALRFEALMSDPPEAMYTLKENSNWSGSFFNWNDDYSQSTWSDGSSARLWAWRTTLIKWISQTNLDGSCYLPTREMVEALAADCLEEAENSEGSIQGCRAP